MLSVRVMVIACVGATFFKVFASEEYDMMIAQRSRTAFGMKGTYITVFDTHLYCIFGGEWIIRLSPAAR